MIKKILIGCGLLFVVLLCCLVSWDRWITRSAAGKIYDDVETVPHQKVGLVLGTSPISYWTGRKNLYFDNRMKAAADLYNSGKVDRLIVSGGDYREKEENGFDEPKEMRDALIKLGVPESKIDLDYDGTRTLFSISNLKKKYGYDSAVIISQKYHNERALYQAKKLGIDAIAYNARTPGRCTSWWRNRGREVLARAKMFFEIM